MNCDDSFDVSGGNLGISMAMFAQTRGCFCGDLISAVERVHTFVILLCLVHWTYSIMCVGVPAVSCSQACVFDATETGDFAMLPAAVEAFLQECIDVYALLLLLLLSCVCALIFSESCHVVQLGL